MSIIIIETELPSGTKVQGAKIAGEVIVLLSRNVVWPTRLSRWRAVARVCESLE